MFIRSTHTKNVSNDLGFLSYTTDDGNSFVFEILENWLKLTEQTMDTSLNDHIVKFVAITFFSLKYRATDATLVHQRNNKN